jgi:hypothetical protein
MKMNWDKLSIEWSFDYRANINEKPYIGECVLSCPQNEITITGIIQPLTLFCQEDFNEIWNWFNLGSKLVFCPFLYRCPISFDGETSIYDPTLKLIKWINSPYQFSGGYYVGSNADLNYNVIDPNLPIQFKLDICPIEREIGYYQPSIKNPIQLDPIPFFVRPRKVNNFFIEVTVG